MFGAVCPGNGESDCFDDKRQILWFRRRFRICTPKAGRESGWVARALRVEFSLRSPEISIDSRRYREPAQQRLSITRGLNELAEVPAPDYESALDHRAQNLARFVIIFGAVQHFQRILQHVPEQG